MKNRTATILATLALTAGVSFAAPVPAVADGPITSCSENPDNVCEPCPAAVHFQALFADSEARVVVLNRQLARAELRIARKNETIQRLRAQLAAQR